jgi:hypothetical protein
MDALRRCPAEWAVAGGWAIDLFLGRVTRPHADVDIAVWRDEQSVLRTYLEPDWQLDVAENHQLRPWRAKEWLSLPLFEIHARARRAPELHLELLLNDRDARSWIFRRDPTITYPLERTLLRRADVRYLAPEIVLLYKSKQPRASDAADFTAILPMLSGEQRTWLREAIAKRAPTHEWLERLRTGETD